MLLTNPPSVSISSNFEGMPGLEPQILRLGGFIKKVPGSIGTSAAFSDCLTWLMDLTNMLQNYTAKDGTNLVIFCVFLLVQASGAIPLVELYDTLIEDLIFSGQCQGWICNLIFRQLHCIIYV